MRTVSTPRDCFSFSPEVYVSVIIYRVLVVLSCKYAVAWKEFRVVSGRRYVNYLSFYLSGLLYWHLLFIVFSSAISDEQTVSGVGEPDRLDASDFLQSDPATQSSPRSLIWSVLCSVRPHWTVHIQCMSSWLYCLAQCWSPNLCICFVF